MFWYTGIVVGIIVGAVGLWLYLKIFSKRKVMEAQKLAEQLLSDAKSEAESLKKEKLIEVQEELYFNTFQSFTGILALVWEDKKIYSTNK